jgi:hypothetical protein
MVKRAKYDPSRFQIQLTHDGTSSLIDSKSNLTLHSGDCIEFPQSMKVPGVSHYRVRQIDTSREGHPVLVMQGYDPISNSTTRLRSYDEVLCFTHNVYGTSFIPDFTIVNPHSANPKKKRRKINDIHD